MKWRGLSIFFVGMTCSLGVGFLLSYPFIYSIEFSVRGYHGDERIAVTKNDGAKVLLTETAIGKGWKKIRLTSYFPVTNIQLLCLNLNSIDPPRQISISSGVIRVYRVNLMGNVIEKRDWLNVDSQYFSPEGGLQFGSDSPTMATLRGGITGWTGYYQLVAN